MNILQIDHLGIAVNSLEEGQAFWCDIMGLKMAGTETVAEQKVTTAFCPVGEAEVEHHSTSFCLYSQQILHQ